MTQNDIEDVLTYALNKGIKVLQIGLPETVLKDYQDSVAAKVIRLAALPGETLATYQRAPTGNFNVMIVAMDD